LSVSLSSPYYVEFLHPQASKGLALAAVCGQLDIDREYVLAVGDSFNDLSMFEFAGMAVAMDNAHSDVKKHANIVAPSNNDDGVAHMLREFVLG
jgi:hydroxymethylpyrimidine pyrophosphatase-like HAD family hydrolase